jgi:hypothetical protein
MVNSAAAHDFRSDAPDNLGLQRQPEQRNTSYRLADFLFIVWILILGALAFVSRDRASDFLYDDVYYADCAKSLLARGFYGILNRPETTQPPGVSAILALLCLARGCTRAVFLSAMVVFETLGFLACYELLRRLAHRAVAGSICLLLMSSSLYFSLATQGVSTCFPFLFATMTALLAARKLEKAARRGSQFAWGFLLAVLLAASLMFGSTAIALLGSIVAWIAASMLRDRLLGVMRLQKFLAVLLVAVAVEGIWMSHQPFDEWPRVPGFPGPYLRQIVLKNGHFPELGKATLVDIPVRIAGKAFEESTMLAQVLVRRWIDVSWASLLIAGPVLLILVGWGYSIWTTGGGLEDWYFAGAQFILLLWPWRLDTRSCLPLVPLACLYLWRGVAGLGFLAKDKPGVLGAVWLPLAVVLMSGSWLWMRGVGSSSPAKHFGLQAAVSFAGWIISGIVAAGMLWKGSSWVGSLASSGNWFSGWIETLRIRPRAAAQILGGSLVAWLIVMGVAKQLKIRSDNLDLGSAQHRAPADVEAALWVWAHTPPNAVVMARQVPATYHYSGREMVWFPPSSNAQILMEGIRKYKVNYVILIRRKQSYFLPPEEDCFAAVLAENAKAFLPAVETASYRIYEVK